MPDLYYLPESNDAFSAVDSCFFLRFNYKGDDFYLPFFAYIADLMNAESELFECDTDCIYNMSSRTIQAFLRFAQEGHDISEHPLLDRNFDIEYWTGNQEYYGNMTKVTSVSEAFNDMSYLYLDGYFHESQEYFDYKNGGSETLRRHTLLRLSPYFPHLCHRLSTPAPNTFL